MNPGRCSGYNELRVMKSNTYRILIIVGLTAVTMSIHYGALPHSHLLHDLHRRLCYVPIILAALWFGLAGGAVTAAGISLLLVPYIVLGWNGLGGAVVNEFIEIFFYNAIGILAGVLIEGQQRGRRRQEELSARLRRAERLSALGEAAAALAHEVRNPLGGIRGSAEIIGSSSTPQAKKAEFLSVLLKEVDRLNQVVENFLKLSRPIPLNLREVVLRDEIESVANIMTAEADRSGVTVAVDIDQHMPAVRMDPDRMRQVFLNTFINGFQAMPGGGALTIRARVRNDAATGGSGTAAITISDTGAGIPREDLGKVFAPFFTTKDSGTGLGLAVSKRIVEEHGGRITLDSIHGRGTTVTIVLPISPEEAVR